MTKRKPKEEIVEEELDSNEEYVSRDDLELMFTALEDEETGEATVWVRFSGFDDMEEAEEYADNLQEILPLLLFQSTRLQ